MKKILWLIFLSFSLTNFAYAKVYYSDYSNFSEFQEKEVISSELVDVIVEERYLWYKNEQVLGDYKLYNMDDSFTNNCELREYSNWSDKKEENVGYVYESRDKYEYTKSKSVRYIHLYNLQGSYGAFRIPELSIFVNNKEIKYSYTCDGCMEGFDEYINNGIYIENESYIENGGSLIIDLGKFYPLNQIEVVFYIYDLGPTDKLYTIGYSTDKKDIFIAQSYLLKYSDYHWTNAKKEVKTIYDFNILLTDWTTKEISYEKQNDLSIVDTKVTKQYRYQEKWCQSYETIKEYYQEYSNKAVSDYIYKDIDSQKKYYSYRTRDKLELEINEINDYNFDLNNFIIYKSDFVDITHNIDWNKNGEYQVNFQLNDMKITENVIVNIAENTILELEEEITDLKQKIQNLKLDIVKQKELYEEALQLIEEKLNNCQLDNNCLIENLKQKEQIIKNQEKMIFDLSTEINNIQSVLEDKENLIVNLSQNNKKLENDKVKLLEEITKLKKEATQINEEIILKYNEKISELEELNNFYKKKNEELKEDLKNINETIKNNNIVKNNLIEEYEEKIKELELQLNQNLNDLKQEKNNNELLNSKLNGYFLKINSKNFVSISLIILLIIFLCLLYYNFKNKK